MQLYYLFRVNGTLSNLIHMIVKISKLLSRNKFIIRVSVVGEKRKKGKKKKKTQFTS